MHSLKYFVLLISLIVVLAADKDKEKSQDLQRASTNYAATQAASGGSTNCDILAKYFAAYANNLKANADKYSTTAQNYAAEISNLYGTQNNAAQSASSGYSAPAPAAGYAAGSSGSSSASSALAPASGYSTSSATVKPSSGYSVSPASSYSTGGSGYSSSSGYSSGASGYGSSVKPASASGYSSGSSSYAAPAPASSYSTGGSGYSSSKTVAPASGYSAGGSGYSSSSSAVKPASGYSTGGLSYGSSSAVKPASGYSSGSTSVPSASYFGYGTPSSYSRFADIARYMANREGFDAFNPRNFYAYQQQQGNYAPMTFNERSGFSHDGANNMRPAHYSPMSFNLQNERSGFPQEQNSVQIDGTSQPIQANDMRTAHYAPMTFNERSGSPKEYSSVKIDGGAKPTDAPATATYKPTKSEPASASYTAGKQTADSLPQSYSRFGTDEATNYRSYGSASPSYDSADSAVAVPICPQNYLLSCQSSVQSVPCVQQSQGYSAKY